MKKSQKNMVVSAAVTILLAAALFAGREFLFDKPEDPASSLPMEGSEFEVHYIDVGQGDSSLVICDGRTMLIDGGNVADSSLLVAYLKKLSIEELDYIICTHAHEDHAGGLSGPLHVVTVRNVLAPKTEADTKAYTNFRKAAENQKITICHPDAGETIPLGSSEVRILGPVSETGSNLNNTSIVLRIVYGETSFLFTGDAEREEELAILGQNFTLSSTVLKVGHHGSETSTSYVFLREIMPQYAIISVGKGNTYGHPDEAVLSRLRDAEVKVYTTMDSGDIVVKSDGKIVTVLPSKAA